MKVFTYCLIIFCLVFCQYNSFAQNTTLLLNHTADPANNKNDTTKISQVLIDSIRGIPVIEPQTLSEVTVNAYEENKKLIDESAPIGMLSQNALSRYSNDNILPAVNTIAGVRMEQRSPASYRLNIRGSSLRSPFGVREVKIYYNGIPVTDPSGDTYLNQFSFQDFGSVEIIKGPAGSAYGAGIGGAMLIESPLKNYSDSTSSFNINYTTGSYDKQGINAALKWGNKNAKNLLSYSGIRSNGYRDHSAMYQKVVSHETLLYPNSKQQVDIFVHYNDLYYQTPGGLNAAEYQKDPKMSRPAAGPYPSAQESQAAIFQKNLLLGVNQTYYFNNHFLNTTVLYGSYTDFTNPTFRNYEYRKEPHFGGRTVFKYQQQYSSTSLLTLLAGTEMQQGYFSVKDFGNTAGTPDTLQTEYHINNFTALVFAQADLAFARTWDITAGASINLSNLQFINLYPYPVQPFNRNFQNKLIPRIALLKKFNHNNLSVYASLSEGFSPPTISELLPSTNILNTTLNPESGTDYEIGSRGNLFHDKFYYDADGFIFNLTKSISERVDNSGADYYVNAGGTLQHGVEGYLLYHLINNYSQFISKMDIWTSQTWFDFHYKNYKVLTHDYSGNQLPGVAPYSSITGLDIISRAGFAAHISWNYMGKIPLNDANSVKASAYNLVEARLGYQHHFPDKLSLKIFAGVDNLLNEKYSLGDDINAAAGRYYNAAAGINYYGSISLKYSWK